MVAVAIFSLWASFSVGSTLAERKCSAEIAALQEDKEKLVAAVAEQNEELDRLAIELDKADAVRKEALKRAQEQQQASEGRIRRLERTLAEASSCDAVLRSYWELRQ